MCGRENFKRGMLPVTCLGFRLIAVKLSSVSASLIMPEYSDKLSLRLRVGVYRQSNGEELIKGKLAGHRGAGGGALQGCYWSVTSQDY